MKIGLAIMLLSGASALPLPGLAADKGGMAFSHKDWELACDNTGTCRAAGYQVDGAEPAVSLLLVRDAGAKQAVSAKIQLGSYAEGDVALAANVSHLVIKSGGRKLGTIDLVPGAQSSPLNGATLAVIMPALLQSSSVVFSSGKQDWTLSTAGASAVLLKMDEAQGRIGTVGALVRKGSKGETGVLQPTVAPVVVAAPIPRENRKDLFLEPAQRAEILQALRQGSNRDECPDMYPSAGQAAAGELRVHRLSADKLLAGMVCETYAYNQSVSFWVINSTAPFAPVGVAVDASDYSGGEISASQKGRGLGDCWSSNVHTWNGRQFVWTKESTTGMCRLVAPGGAWDLPTYVTTVRKSDGTRR
ncbi:DUF1176 domain-containing protein [Janthinobacterium sp. RB2R34]|uniref:DUF1176 domain-containing protein n=1 Tax=Janthinobacterium sp. RB2R34 TaxID=3424193 RepID=UPI003F24CF22